MSKLEPKKIYIAHHAYFKSSNSFKISIEPGMNTKGTCSKSTLVELETVPKYYPYVNKWITIECSNGSFQNE